jgi:uncharacterized protein
MKTIEKKKGNFFRNILPKEYGFYGYFEEHIAITVKIAEEFLALTNDFSNFENHAKKIHELEADADVINHTCIDALHRTFITPIERTDIFDLIKRMDDIADFIDSAAARISLYDIKFIRTEAKELANILVLTTKELEIAVKGLRHLKESDLIKDKCKNVHELENTADDIQKQAISNLFKENDAMNLIKWKEIFDRLEKAVDRCESLANIIEGVLIDNA